MTKLFNWYEGLTGGLSFLVTLVLMFAFVYVCVMFCRMIIWIVYGGHYEKRYKGCDEADIYKPVMWYRVLMIFLSVIWPLAILIDYHIIKKHLKTTYVCIYKVSALKLLGYY